MKVLGSELVEWTHILSWHHITRAASHCPLSSPQHQHSSIQSAWASITVTDIMSHMVLTLILLALHTDLVLNQRYEVRQEPRFDDHVPSNVSVQQGDTAYIHCRIFNAENA